MKNLKAYITQARKEHWALGQFNFSDWSQVKGIVQVAQRLESPLILGTSEGESAFVGLEEAVAMRDVLRKKTGLPIFLNLDHGKSLDVLAKAIEAGYDMVHFDGSKLPLEENIAITKQVVALAKKNGVVVEGEVGRISTDASRVYQEAFVIKEEDLTNLEEAQRYVAETGVAVLAISIGTFHGIDARGESPHIRFDRLEEITQSLAIPFVLHGGSGTPMEDLEKAIRMGVVKININTETRLAFAASLRKALIDHPEEVVPYRYFANPISAVASVTEKYIEQFGSQKRV